MLAPANLTRNSCAVTRQRFMDRLRPDIECSERRGQDVAGTRRLIVGTAVKRPCTAELTSRNPEASERSICYGDRGHRAGPRLQPRTTG